jgi:hypothetical protein
VKVCGKERAKNEFGNDFSGDLRASFVDLFNIRAFTTGEILINGE